jgi:polysaccharide biosynthesis transport protein
MESQKISLSRQSESSVHPPRTELLEAFSAPGGSNNPSTSGLNRFLELWDIARTNKITLIALVAASTLLGFLFGIPKTPLYQASTSLEVLSLNQDFMNMRQSSPVTAGDNSFETSELQTQVRVLTSSSMMHRVLEKLESSRTPQMQIPKQRFAALRRFLRFSTPSRKLVLDRTVKSIKVTALGRTRLLEVKVDSADPQLAADAANAFATEYIAQTIENRWKPAENTNAWLTRELADTRAKLARSEDALQTYARNSGLIFVNSEASIVTEKLQQIQQQLSTATADRIDKQSRHELALASSPESLPEVLNDPGLRDIGAKITEIKRQLANLSATYTPEFTKAKRLQAELESLQSAFNQNRAEILVRLKNEYQEALRKEQLLANDYATQVKQVAGQGEKSIQYNILKREVESNRQLYDTMLQQLKQSSVVSAMQASNVRVLDSASVPLEPFSPNYLANSAVGFLSGLLLGVIFVVAKHGTNRTVRGPGDVQFWTRLPELGAIPSITRDLNKAGQNVWLSARPAGASGSGGNKVIKFGPRVNQFLAADSVRYQANLLADAFRSVIASILFANENGTQPKTLVLTSTSAADGKTTVIVNIGIAMAETQKRVLIVDADLRGPLLHKGFDLPNERGLVDLLKQPVVTEEALDAIIQKTGVPGLNVLTGGSPTPTAAKLLHSANLPKVLAMCAQRYDLILIDTPPMLHMPDARILGKLADAVVLVARAEKTTRDAIIAAKQRFAEDRVHVMGTVLNGWDPKKSQRGYYGSSGAGIEDTYKRYAATNAAHTA